jgi:hypothetical protein
MSRNPNEDITLIERYCDKCKDDNSYINGYDVRNFKNEIQWNKEN